ncbi:MAG: response regulator [Proteobacteria bacterium]|jgi:two-component system, OmpR family, response regulator BaeR|nr:response regulator [Pseudomonadota bacterium]
MNSADKISAKALVMIVEDEIKLAELLKDYLQQSGYPTLWVGRGDQVIESLRANPVALVLLDLMLPGKDGIDICREIRQFSNVPIIMTTARIEEIDRLIGLELGADDYICKPYSPREVVARVKAVLRRQQSGEIATEQQRLVLDGETYRASLDGVSLNLTRVEFRLLMTLAARPGKVFARDTLMNGLYDDYRVVSDRTVDTHVKNVRQKAAVISGEDLIRSVYGVGYSLEIPG